VLTYDENLCDGGKAYEEPVQEVELGRFGAAHAETEGYTQTEDEHIDEDHPRENRPKEGRTHSLVIECGEYNIEREH
jgi:hypothetical protein